MSAYRDRPRDFDYMGWVKTQPCCAAETIVSEAQRCQGPIEADHAGRRGLSRKADDLTCIPLCRQHHRERTDHSGAFRSWCRDDMRAWLAEQIHRAQERWARYNANPGIPF